jgi:hypothetical protein
MNELQKCLNGTSDYCHAEKVKALYAVLNAMGNKPGWQLYVLGILKEGIQLKRDEDYKNMKAAFPDMKPKKNSREWCDQRGF